MASGSGELSARLSLEDHNIEERLLRETLFSHYKKHKVEISSAINKTFPFLHILRDRGFITNQLFTDSEESCRNLVPVPKVVYNVLHKLEDTFDLSLLEALFSSVNTKEYPDLIRIYSSFTKVIKEKFYPQLGEEEDRFVIQPSLEQGTNDNSHRSLPWSHADCSSHVDSIRPESRLSELLYETRQMNAKRKDPSSDENDARGSQQTNEASAHEYEPAGSSEQVTLQRNYTDARHEMPRLLPWNTEMISSDDSEDSSEEGEPPETSTSTPRSQPVANYAGFMDSIQEKESQEATCSHSQVTPEPMDLSVSLLLRKRAARRDNSSDLSEQEEFPESLHSGLGSGSADEDPVNIRNKPIWWKRNRKTRIGSDSSTELSNGEESQGTSSSVPRNGSETMRGGPRKQLAQGTRGLDRAALTVEGCTKFQQFPKHVRKRKMIVPQRSNLVIYLQPDPNVQGPARKRGRPRKQLARGTRGRKKGIKRVNAGPLRKRRERVPKIPRDKNMNFHSPELSVTCGEIKGVLYKSLLNQGTSEKCIQGEDGRWFTPREFEIQGNREKSKNWKLSVRCGGWPLLSLIKRGFLPAAPVTKKRVIIACPVCHMKGQVTSGSDFIDPYPENSNLCAVCQDGGRLVCCDTCTRSFHEDCHIHPVETERNPWSCIFCSIKTIQAKCPEDQPGYQESEILKRQMLPEEQLSREGPQDPRERMWLDKIKKKLKEKHYHQVEDFVRDMRLFFQMYKVYCRGNDLVGLGLRLETKFEENFQNIFAIQGTTRESSFQCGRISPLQS